MIRRIDMTLDDFIILVCIALISVCFVGEKILH